MNLKDLYEIACYVCQQTRQLVPFSSNRPDRDDQAWPRTLAMSFMRGRENAEKSRAKFLKWNMAINEDKVTDDYSMRRVKQSFFGANSATPTIEEWDDHANSLLSRGNKKYHKDGTRVTPLEESEWDAKNAIKFGIGNCGELCALAFSLLIEYPRKGLPDLHLPAIPEGENIRIEQITIDVDGDPEGDHGFVVFNRAKGSELNNISTWGDALIVDPWFGEGEVVDVASYLKGKLKKSECFEYIKSYESELSKEKGYDGYLSAGHSARWKEHRAAKNEPLNLRDWTARPIYGKDAPENAPWVEEDKTIPSKKRKFGIN